MRKRAILLLVAMVGVLVVGSGVALAASIACTANPCLGTPEADSIDGSNNPERIKALAGNDSVIAWGANDEIYGDEGNDVVNGDPGNDTIYGGPDGDGSVQGTAFTDLNLEGGNDSDTVYGGGGADLIDAAANDEPYESAAEPVDRSYGGRGNDQIYAADGNKDIINCGKGRDVAFIDEEIDANIKGCETKFFVVRLPM
jgi:Ca2+-binding RTX toxin-like protein